VSLKAVGIGDGEGAPAPGLVVRFLQQVPASLPDPRGQAIHVLGSWCNRAGSPRPSRGPCPSPNRPGRDRSPPCRPPARRRPACLRAPALLHDEAQRVAVPGQALLEVVHGQARLGRCAAAGARSLRRASVARGVLGRSSSRWRPGSDSRALGRDCGSSCAVFFLVVGMWPPFRGAGVGTGRPALSYAGGSTSGSPGRAAHPCAGERPGVCPRSSTALVR